MFDKPNKDFFRMLFFAISLVFSLIVFGILYLVDKDYFYFLIFFSFSSFIGLFYSSIIYNRNNKIKNDFLKEYKLIRYFFENDKKLLIHNNSKDVLIITINNNSHIFENNLNLKGSYLLKNNKWYVKELNIPNYDIINNEISKIESFYTIHKNSI